jgi:FlaG/FlaF family flagellin (archaellin)
MKKAIATIIAVILLLLLVVALAGSAWFYIYGYWKKGVVSQNIETGGAFCGEGFAAVPIKNIGTDPINISSTKVQTEEYLPTGNTSILLHFNEGSGSSISDSSANNYVGTAACANPKWLSGADCKFGSCINFTKTPSCYVYMGDAGSNGTNFTANFTVDAWVKRYANGVIVTKAGWDTGYLMGFILGIQTTDSKLTWCVGDGGIPEDYGLNGYCIKYQTILQNNTWYHIIAVRETTGSQNISKLYVNGVLVNSSTYANYQTYEYDDIYIGGPAGGSGWSRINGTIDEVRILNRSMTDAEIKSQQEWNYVCSGSGNKYTCGDLTITKNSGGYLDPYFDKGVFGGYESALLRDRNCNGNCEYYIMTKSGRASKVQLFDC